MSRLPDLYIPLMIHNHSQSRADRVLGYVIAAGLAIQLGGIAWLYENYATMVYLLFFVPVLYAFFRWRRDLKTLITQADRSLIIALVALLVWVSLSVLWSEPELPDSREWKYAFKVSALILIYILGVALLAKRSPALIRPAVIGALIAVAAMGAATVVNDYMILGNAINSTVRLSRLGFDNWTTELNPVVGGIFFGAFTLLAGLLVLDGAIGRGMKAVIVTCGCFSLSYMLLTWTRTSLLSLGAILLILCLWKGSKRHYMAFSAGVTLALIALWMAIPGIIEEYIHRGGMGSWRPQTWLAIWRECLDNLYFGVGINKDMTLSVHRTMGDNVETVSLPHGHNFYLQLLYWCGLVGLGLYLTVLARLLITGYRNSADHCALLGLGILAYFLIVQMFDVYSIFNRPHYYWVCVWFPTGLLLGRCQRPVLSGSQRR